MTMTQTTMMGATLCHNTYGDGVVIALKGEYATLRFQDGAERKFSLPIAVKRGTLSAKTAEVQAMLEQVQEAIPEAQQKASVPKKDPYGERIVFCNITWMKNYQGVTDEDRPVYGGAFVAENGDANEACNFLPIIVTAEGEDSAEEYYLGSYETKSYGDRPNQTKIERIRGCSARRNQDCAEHVTVVWCAKDPEGKTCVVGWYEDATVLRNYAIMPIDEEDGSSWERWYNVIAPAEKGVLLPCEQRREPRWRIPRHQVGKSVKFGFGQANIWYASEPEADDFVHQIYTQIHSYGKKIIFQEDSGRT